jgi:hypothetical protein
MRFVRRDGVWRVELSEQVVGANELAAQGMLKQLGSTEGVWRSNDSDRNGQQDYWTHDVAGSYYFKDAVGQTQRYIDIAIAKADCPGLGRYTQEPPLPQAGYWIKVMKSNHEGEAYAASLDKDGLATHPSQHAFCAYPAEYGKTGKNTYIVNEEGVLYFKDLGPNATGGIDQWPAKDPTTAGWTACE